MDEDELMEERSDSEDEQDQESLTAQAERICRELQKFSTQHGEPIYTDQSLKQILENSLKDLQNRMDR